MLLPTNIILVFLIVIPTILVIWFSLVNFQPTFGLSFWESKFVFLDNFSKLNLFSTSNNHLIYSVVIVACKGFNSKLDTNFFIAFIFLSIFMMIMLYIIYFFCTSYKNKMACYTSRSWLCFNINYRYLDSQDFNINIIR